MTESSVLPVRLLMLIALLQGALLLYIDEGVTRYLWLQARPQWLFACLTVAIVAPLFMLLSLERGNGRRLLAWVVPFSVLIGLLAYYTGHQLLPVGKIKVPPVAVAYVAAMTVACFKALMYIQQRVDGAGLAYGPLFRSSWRNFLILGLALLFTGIFYAILMLWAALFKVIKIDFFYDLFTEKRFLYLALGTAHGVGISIFRDQIRVIDTLTRMLQALMKFLLPLVVLLGIVFLFALPFTGLAPLWSTGRGTTLILCLQLFTLFFLNAVYQDHVDVRPYPLPVHRFIYAGVALLPVYSGIALYGLLLRVEQHGLSVGRCWGLLLWALLAAFSAGYLWSIASLRDRWTARLGPVNVAIGLLVMTIFLLVNSPLLDFRKIAVASQLARLDLAAATAGDFDFRYFRDDLGRPGYLALQRIRDDAGSPPKVVAAIDKLYRADEKAQPATVVEQLRIWPPGRVLPAGLQQPLRDLVKGYSWLFKPGTPVYLFAVDLNADGRDDYVVYIPEYPNGAFLFEQRQDSWHRVDMSVSGPRQPDVEAAIAADAVQVVVPQWKNLRIGDVTLEPRDAAH